MLTMKWTAWSRPSDSVACVAGTYRERTVGEHERRAELARGEKENTSRLPRSIILTPGTLAMKWIKTALYGNGTFCFHQFFLTDQERRQLDAKYECERK